MNSIDLAAEEAVSTTRFCPIMTSADNIAGCSKHCALATLMRTESNEIVWVCSLANIPEGITPTYVVDSPVQYFEESPAEYAEEASAAE